METYGAYVSIQEIVNSVLLRMGKTIHSTWKILPLACDAVREIALTSSLMIQHTILTKQNTESWFTLPSNYTDYLSVGIRQGDMWRPIPVEKQLMASPMIGGDGQFTVPEHTGEFNIGGDTWQKWVNNDCCGDLNQNGYYPYLFPYGWWFYWSDHMNDYGESTGRYFGYGDGQRNDICYINTQDNIIMVPNCFCNELYLVYTGIGKVDTMTHIDVRAQAAVEAYVAWKYEANKRNGINAGRALKEEFNLQHQIMRARMNELDATSLHRILTNNYGQTQRMR